MTISKMRVFPPGLVDPAVRRRVMASIKKKDTRPELALRRALWSAGARGWRCHVKLLGRPDIVFGRWRVAVFCDGVWWHGHPDYLPKGKRGPYWDAKIAMNMERDERVNRELTASGWRIVRLWDIDVLSDPERAVLAVLDALRTAGWRPKKS